MLRLICFKVQIKAKKKKNKIGLSWNKKEATFLEGFKNLDQIIP